MILDDIFPGRLKALWRRLTFRTPHKALSRNFSVDPMFLTRRETAKLRDDLIAAAAVAGEATLVALHKGDLLYAPVFCMPWRAWRLPRLLIEDSDALWAPEPGEEGPAGDLKRLLYAAARQARAKPAYIHALDAVIADEDAIRAALPDLSLPWIFELAVYALAERRWPLLALISAHALDADLGYDRARIELVHHYQEFLFECHLRASYGLHEDTFIREPHAFFNHVEACHKKAGWARVLDRDCPAAHSARGLMMVMRGQLADSFPHFEKCRGAAGHVSNLFDRSGLVFSLAKVRGLDLEANRKNWAAYIQHEDHFRHDPTRETGMLVAADWSYFEQVFDLYIRLFRVYNPGGLVHLLLLNPRVDSSELQTRFNVLEAETGVRVNFTVEHNRLMQLMPKHTQGFAQTTRHAFFGRFLTHYKALMLSDIDGVVTENIKTLMEIGAYDGVLSAPVMAVHGRAYSAWPADSVKGSIMGFRNTPGAHTYLELIERYVFLCFDFCLSQNRHFVSIEQTAHMVCTFMGELDGGFRIKKEILPFMATRDLRDHTRMDDKVGQMKTLLAELESKAHGP